LRCSSRSAVPTFRARALHVTPSPAGLDAAWLWAGAALLLSCAPVTNVEQSPSEPKVEPQGPVAIAEPARALLPFNGAEAVLPAPSAPSVPPAATTTMGTVRLSVSSDGVRRATRFGLSATRELFIHSEFAELSGQHLLALRVFAPSGIKYDELRVALTDSQGPQDKLKLDVGALHGVELRQVAPLKPSQVDLVLPVAGTFITQRSMAGKWTIEAHVDGEAVARAATSFVLQ